MKSRRNFSPQVKNIKEHIQYIFKYAKVRENFQMHTLIVKKFTSFIYNKVSAIYVKTDVCVCTHTYPFRSFIYKNNIKTKQQLPLRTILRMLNTFQQWLDF